MTNMTVICTGSKRNIMKIELLMMLTSWSSNPSFLILLGKYIIFRKKRQLRKRCQFNKNNDSTFVPTFEVGSVSSSEFEEE